MRVTVRGLRQWIVAAAVLLIAVVAGFLFYGRYRFRRVEKDLPARLGANIQQSANEFIYTQSSHGHPLFTLKASKELQLRSGHVLLHNVDITLYGPPGSGRTDRIFGNDFDYDQSHGIATSQGDVTIELQGTGTNPVNGGDNSPDANMIRVHTRGLTFVQKTGEATTTQPVEFQLPRAAGTSVGADYNSKIGEVVLNSQVHITTSSNGKPAVIDAAQATLQRASLQGFLVNPRMQYETENGSADAATVHFRKDGTTERVDAVGHVQMKTDAGVTVDAATARILLDVKSQPTEADLGGGIQFASGTAQETMRGSAMDGTLLFGTFRGSGAGTVLRHAEFRQDVQFMDTATATGPQGRAERQMQGQKLDVEFAPPRAGHGPEAQRAIAEGNPVLVLEQIPVREPARTTRISGDRLVATLGEDNVLQTLDGTGHTQIVQSSTDGSHDQSRGDVLRATFEQRPAPARKGAHAAESPGQGGRFGPRKKGIPAGPRMATTLESAVQDGNVTLTETPASHPTTPTSGASGVPGNKPGATTEPSTLTGWAQHAEYHAADELLHLTGNPRITDGATMQLAAETIDYHRDTQNADALGDVKATYTQPSGTQGSGTQQAARAAGGGAAALTAVPTMGGGNGPVHVIAERAAMNHATNQSTFYGTVQAPARMWQDADSLLAPVIEIDRNKDVLKAWGENTGAMPVVNANFTTALGAKHEASLVRVRSETLVYSDQERKGDFHGSVSVDGDNGVLRCDDALLFLKPAVKTPLGTAAAGQKAGAGKQNSQLDHLNATGHVMFTQPGRRGDGEKLVYTADDGKYVLTGTAAARPTLWDRMHGITTGEELIFNSQDGAVQVVGGKSGAVTETRAPK
jgi:lipopolysaccharide export system protein LptA